MLKFNKRLIILFIGIFVFLHSTIEANDTKEEKLIDSVKSLAFQYLGIDSTLKPDIFLSIKKDIYSNLKDSKIPFSLSTDENKTIWEITINEIHSLSTRSETLIGNKYPRNLKIFIDSTSELPIKVTSRIKKMNDTPYTDPNQATIEKEFLSFGSSFYGNPSEMPIISFLEAYNLARHQYVKTIDIIAIYVLWSNNMNKVPKPVWAILLRGNIENNDEYSILSPNYFINIIDAETGQHIGGGEATYMKSGTIIE